MSVTTRQKEKRNIKTDSQTDGKNVAPMQSPRRNSPAERHKDGKSKNVDRWEVREEGIRLDPFNRFDHSLKKMLIKNMCKRRSQAGGGGKQN